MWGFCFSLLGAERRAYIVPAPPVNGSPGSRWPRYKWQTRSGAPSEYGRRHLPVSVGAALNRVCAAEERGPWVWVTTSWCDFRSCPALFCASTRLGGSATWGGTMVRSHHQDGNSLNRWEQASSLGQGITKWGWDPGGSDASGRGGEGGVGRGAVGGGVLCVCFQLLLEKTGGAVWPRQALALSPRVLGVQVSF